MQGDTRRRGWPTCIKYRHPGNVVRMITRPGSAPGDNIFNVSCIKANLGLQAI
jgi:hypothetical protein